MQSKNVKLVHTNNTQIFNIELNLGFKPKFIGKLYKKGVGAFTTKRNRKQVLKKLGALGINHELLTCKEISFRWILIYFEGEKLITTRSYFLEKGKALEFGKKGYELQVFLPISEFGIEKAREYEKHKVIQKDLFEEGI